MMRRLGRSRDRWLNGSFPGGAALLLAHSAFGADTAIAYSRLEGSTTKSGGVMHRESTSAVNDLAILPNVKTGFVIYIEYDKRSCLTLPSSFSAPVAPTHGMLSYGSLVLPISSDDVCNGWPGNYSAAYYTWTDSTPGQTQDSFQLQWATADGKYAYTSDWAVQLGPRILMSGMDITNANPPITVAAGQQIALSVSTSSVGVQSQAWTVSPTVVGGFSPSNTEPCNAGNACPAPVDTSQPSTTFYWVDAGNNRQVTFNYTTTDGQSGSASTMFNVLAPSNVHVDVAPNTVNFTPPNRVGLGDSNNHIPGITFTVSGSNPPEFSGIFKWGQVLTDYTQQYTGGISETCTIGVGLDNWWPYPSWASDKTGDIPEMTVGGSSFSKILHLRAKMVFTAKMFLLWDSQTPNSIPVPLGSTLWGWSATLNRPTPLIGWTLENSGLHPLKPVFKLGIAFPQWVTIAHNHDLTCN